MDAGWAVDGPWSGRRRVAPARPDLPNVQTALLATCASSAISATPFYAKTIRRNAKIRSKMKHVPPGAIDAQSNLCRASFRRGSTQDQKAKLEAFSPRVFEAVDVSTEMDASQRLDSQRDLHGIPAGLIARRGASSIRTELEPRMCAAVSVVSRRPPRRLVPHGAIANFFDFCCLK